MTDVRSELPGDQEAVRSILEQAFGQPGEADLVDRLRAGPTDYLALVATRDDDIVGHIAFSRVTVASNPQQIPVRGLAPMAVAPQHQRSGIGGALVRAGLDACTRQGDGAVVVLGHPEYYPRFGFEAAADLGLRSEYDAPREAFMALELVPGALEEVSGLVRYHPLFANL